MSDKYGLQIYVTQLLKDYLFQREFGYAKGRNIVSQLDPDLRFCRRLLPSLTGVYLVEKQQEEYVIRAAHRKHDWGIHHVEREIEVANRIGTQARIPQLIEAYETEKYIGLLKQYIKGQLLIPALITPNIAENLEDTITILHNLGCANLDLKWDNVILCDADRLPYLPDLGRVVFENEVESSEFNQLIERDLHAFKLVLGRTD